MLFSYGNIYLLYMYIFFFFASLSKYSKPNWAGKRTLCKGLASSLSCRVDQVCSCCSWVLIEEKKNAFKKYYVKRRARSLSLSLLPWLPSVLPRRPLVSFRQLRVLGDCWHCMESGAWVLGHQQHKVNPIPWPLAPI